MAFTLKTGHHMKFFSSVFPHLEEEQEKRFGLDLLNTLSKLEINFRIQYCDKNKLSEENAHNNITCISQWNEPQLFLSYVTGTYVTPEHLVSSVKDLYMD